MPVKVADASLRVIVPEVFGLIAANSAPVGVSVKVMVEESATTNEFEVTKASVISAVVPVIVIALVAVTVPLVCSPIPDNVEAVIVSEAPSLIVIAPVWVPTNPPANAFDKLAADPLNDTELSLRVIVPEVPLFIAAN